MYSGSVRRLRLAILVAFAAAACASGARPVAPASSVPRAGPAEALERFTAALAAQRWPEAYALLSGRWRAGYTPARLAADWSAAGPVGRDAADRARALLAAGQPFAVHGRTATLTVGEGRAAVLVEEEGAWRVDALE